MSEIILIYQFNMPMRFMELDCYRAGNVELKKFGDEIRVSEKEKKYLLKMTNGNPQKGGKPIFKVKREIRAAIPEKKEKAEGVE